MSKAERVRITDESKLVLKRVADDSNRFIARDNLDNVMYHIGVLADRKNTQELRLIITAAESKLADLARDEASKISGETE